MVLTFSFFGVKIRVAKNITTRMKKEYLIDSISGGKENVKIKTIIVVRCRRISEKM